MDCRRVIDLAPVRGRFMQGYWRSSQLILKARKLPQSAKMVGLALERVEPADHQRRDKLHGFRRQIPVNIGGRQRNQKFSFFERHAHGAFWTKLEKLKLTDTGLLFVPPFDIRILEMLRVKKTAKLYAAQFYHGYYQDVPTILLIIILRWRQSFVWFQSSNVPAT
ncbi:hypothetical protein BD410DRAFT_828712 [Rickenella mellea]|uniref:Uncharacterized protein n=1 Tax=Rickenella mellea TaxID=50990 RepID=A0A4Y7Q582_9AGAM|nr:hypothetical protein BD410DRAFT_828712 [Rickenella mellea]